MRFIYVTDTHLTNIPPKYRTKDFFQQMIEKWSEVYEIAKKEDCDFILHGGDLFHGTDPDVQVLLETIRKMDKKMPLYLTVGNHDYKSNVFEHIAESTAMGLLEHAGYLKILKNDLVVEGGGLKILIRTVHYFQKDLREQFKLPDYKKYDYCILVCHATIVNKPVIFKHILASDLETNFDLVLCGHYHIPFDTQVGTTRFINPGSMSRRTRADEDMRRIPQVVLVSLAKDPQGYADAIMSYIPLKSAVNWQKAFLLDQIEDDKEDEERLSEEFSESVQQSVTSFNIDEVIDLLSEERPELKEVIPLCRQYLTKARS
jgi:DNA repair protein SbcD/Mre11